MSRLTGVTRQEVVARGSFWPMPEHLETKDLPSPCRTPQENMSIMTKLRFRDAFVRHQQSLVDFCSIVHGRFDLVVKVLDYLLMDRRMNEERSELGGSTDIRTWERETGPAALREIYQLGHQLYWSGCLLHPSIRVLDDEDSAGLRLLAGPPNRTSFEKTMEQLFALAFLAQPETFLSSGRMYPQHVLNMAYTELECGENKFFNPLMKEFVAIGKMDEDPARR